MYLVGAGPWDPGLLTLRGKQILGRVDLVIYDYLVNPEHLEHAPQAEHRAVGKGTERLSQAEINALLVEAGLAGRLVARLKGGDPFVFGRGGEEAAALVDAGIAFEVVPGVTAAVASAAYAGIPVTHRGLGATLAFCTGHRRADAPCEAVDWAALAKMDTAVFYMGRRNLPLIASKLVAAGRDPSTPVALVEWATRPTQRTRIATLETAVAVADAHQLAPPMTVIVGAVVALRAQIGWFERKPLHGRTVVVTRSKGQQGSLAAQLRDLGAEVISMPTIAFEPGPGGPVREAVERLGTYDWVIFTSANAVDYFLDALDAAGYDARAFGAAKIACVGTQSARRLAERGLKADLVPKARFVAEGLVEALEGTELKGARVLMPRAAVARALIPTALRAAGAQVDLVAVYRTYRPEPEPELVARVVREADVLLFTASSTATHFAAALTQPQLTRVQARAAVASIGPVTSEAARSLGFEVRWEASEYTVSGLVQALVSAD